MSQPKPASEKSPYYDIAEKYGVKIDFRPFIKVESLSAKEFRLQKVSILDHTAVIFTSRHAIDHFFGLCTEMRIAIPETMKYFCVTEAVALYIQKYIQYRKRKIFFGNTGKIEDLVPSIVKHNSEKYFVPMSDVHTDEIKNLLDKNKITHTEAVMYRTVSNDFQEGEAFDYDIIIRLDGRDHNLRNFNRRPGRLPVCARRSRQYCNRRSGQYVVGHEYRNRRQFGKTDFHCTVGNRKS